MATSTRIQRAKAAVRRRWNNRPETSWCVRILLALILIELVRIDWAMADIAAQDQDLHGGDMKSDYTAFSYISYVGDLFGLIKEYFPWFIVVGLGVALVWKKRSNTP